MISKRLPSLSSLIAFESAARHLSFKRAATELSLTPAAISHQIRNLESQLDVKLFDREVRQVSLTDAGRVLANYAQTGLGELRSGIAAVRRHSERKRLTITATTTFTALWLTPRLRSLRNQFPEQEVRILASEQVVDLHALEADFAFRVFAQRSAKAGLDYHWLGQDRLIPVASPALDKSTDKGFSNLPLIHYEFQNSSKHDQTWRKWQNTHRVKRTDKAPPDHIFSDEIHAYHAAIGGQGVALMSRALVASAIQSGLLTQLSELFLTGSHIALVKRRNLRENDVHNGVWTWLCNDSKSGLLLDPIING